MEPLLPPPFIGCPFYLGGTWHTLKEDDLPVIKSCWTQDRQRLILGAKLSGESCVPDLPEQYRIPPYHYGLYKDPEKGWITVEVQHAVLFPAGRVVFQKGRYHYLIRHGCYIHQRAFQIPTDILDFVSWFCENQIIAKEIDFEGYKAGFFKVDNKEIELPVVRRTRWDEIIL